MPTNLLRCIAVSLGVVVALAATAAPAGDIRVYADPVLEVSVDSRALKSEEVPLSLYKAMGLDGGPWWYFAKYDDSKVSGRRYFMVAGNGQYWLDTEPPTKANDLEAQDEVLYLRDGQYQSVDNVVGFSDPDDHVPERVIMGLYRDLVERLIRQLGSPQAIDKELREYWTDLGGKVQVDPYMYRVLESHGIKNMCLNGGWTSADAPVKTHPGMRKCLIDPMKIGAQKGAG